MVGILIVFLANNVIWGIIYMITFSMKENKSISKVFTQPKPPVEELQEASTEDILRSFKDLNDRLGDV